MTESGNSNAAASTPAEPADQSLGIIVANEAAALKPSEQPAKAKAFSFSSDISALSDPSGITAESIGALRTHLLAQHISDGRRSLAICAPSVGVGSTYIAVNLAVAFSLAGIKTLLIDANMRAPGVETYITPNEPIPGLMQCLNNANLQLGDAIQDEVLPNLSVLFAGGVTENAQELLASQMFQEIVDSCMRDFEITIVDTPPANISADVRRVAMIVRYALIIARKNGSYVDDIKILAEELMSDRAKVIGTFLNDF